MAPTRRDELKLADLGLCVSKGPDREHLEVKAHWNPEDVDSWLRRLFPSFFKYSDLHYPNERYHVRPAGKYYYSLLNECKIDEIEEKMTGENLIDLRAPKANASTITRLYFGKYGYYFTKRVIFLTWFSSF